MKQLRLFLLSLMIASATTADAQQHQPLYLQSGTVQLAPNLSEFTLSPQPSDVFDGYYFRVLQFSNLPTPAIKAAMKAEGILLLDYLPKNAFTAAIPERYNRTRLSSFQVVAVHQLSPQQKLNKHIAGGFQEWAIKEQGTVDLIVQYHSSLSLPKVLLAASKHGRIVEHYGAYHSITLRISDFGLNALAAEPWVNYINTVPAPPEKEDTKGRSLHRSNVINSDYATGRHYDGSGVTVAIADDGFVGPHIDFTGRLTNFATGVGSTHGDMTSGICVGAGNLDPSIRGMATGAYLYAFNIGSYPQIVDAVSNYTNYGIVIASTSYSQGCNEYNTFTQAGDQLLYDNPQLEFVFSGGNNNGANCGYGAGGNWGNITGGYKQGKNVIACGNLDPLEVIDPSSSIGPSADGRIKPDICANGRDQLSTDENNTYQVGGGTSAASPGIAGLFAQLYQAYKEQNSTTTAPAALIKACMLNSAEDIGNPGPDFKFGWGRVNAYRALTTLEDNRYLTDSIIQGATNTHTVTVPAGTTEMRCMVYWSDVGGAPLSAPALVNNLNITVTDPSSTVWNPWILDPTPNATTLNNPAVRGVDSLNNMEQVTLENPAAGVYTVSVNGYALPTAGQRYYLVWEFRSEEVTMTYPNGGEGFVPGQTEVLRWDGQRNLGNYTIEYSTDNGGTWNSVANNVPQTLQQLSWVVPSTVSGAVKMRISRNGFTDETDSSFAIIGVPSNITVNWACPDSMQISWNAVTGAAGYKVYALGAKYMDVVGTSATTSLVVAGLNPLVDQWLSVSAVTAEGNIGRRANAIKKTAGLLNCSLANDASLLTISSPGNTTLLGCHDNSAVPVAVTVENNGINPITGFDISYSLNGAAAVTESFTGNITSGTSQLFTLTNTLNLTVSGNYTLDVWISFTGDQNVFNDSLTNQIVVTSGTSQSMPFTEDFESAALCGTASDCEATVCALPNGWINEANGDQDDIDFRTSQGSTISTGTGPDVDHTSGTAGGNYIYLESSACFNKTANLMSTCFDLTTATSPELTFWYHMYGAGMGELHVDIYSQGTWTNDVMTPIVGDQGNNWLLASVNLTPWAGEIINIRFRAITGATFTSDLALDDINIVETTAPPVPAFAANYTTGCTGNVFEFTDQSLNAPNAWLWNFTPATVTFVNGTSATSQNPQVVFNSTGTYDVELTATNNFGGGTVTQTAYLSILPAATAPVIEDFQSGVFPPFGWRNYDSGNGTTWAEALAVTGSDGLSTDAVFMDNFDYNNPGAEDALQTFEVDLTNGISSLLTFDVSYANYNDITYPDSLRIDISTDCGTTWVEGLYLKGYTGLATVAATNNEWTPTLAAHWRNDTVDLSNYLGNNVLVRFVNINGYGNNLYLDNINIDLTVSVNSIDEMGNVNVYPNPSSGLFNFELTGNTAQQVQYVVTDASGRVIKRERLNTGSTYRGLLDLREAPQGIYFLRLESESGNRTIKITKI